MSFRRVPRWMMAAVLGWCAVAARPAVAADATRLTGESQRTRQRFVEAADLEKQGRWADAVESYLRLLDEAGDDLVPDDADSQHYLPARLLVHRRLAGRRELLPPYRARVEARAQRLLEQGESQRDRQALEHVVDNFFCSRSAEAALHLLGDLACERGDFERARRYWQLLEPPAASHALAYPDSKGDVALPRGKQVLARLLAGERDEAETALRAFRKTHPNSTGYLAGRSGNLGATLQRLLDAAEVVRVPSPAGLAPAPTTFAGDATRNGVLSGLLPPFIPKPRYPPIPLPGANPSADDHRLVQRPLTRPAALAFYPVIAHGQVFVADTCRVTAYDLATGKLSGQFDVTGSDPRLAGLRDLRLPLTSDARYTVTIDGERIFARLGQPKMRADRADAASYVVCLQWHPGGETPAERLRPRWLLPALKADAESGPVTLFEGTPVVHDGRLYVAATRLDGNRAVTALACYDARDPVASGPLWQSDVYETGAESVERSRQHLLTLTGPHIVLCSHVGVVVALDEATGRRAWAVRYPMRGPRTAGGEPSPRDLAPCVAAGGRLYAAPADSDRVWCLDAATGAQLWQSDRLEVAHLLGVVQGRVVCTLGGYTSGLCALDAASGRRDDDFYLPAPAAEAWAPFGRGLLLSDRVYWPTRGAGVRDLNWDRRSVNQPTAFQALPGGNLAYGEGCLVVATADRLHVLVGAAVEAAGALGRSGRQPANPASHFQAGLALADAGRAAAALEQFQLAELDDELHDRALRYRYELLLWQADRLRVAGRPAAAVRGAYATAAAPEFGPDRRLAALLRTGEARDDERNGLTLVSAAGLLVPPPQAKTLPRPAGQPPAPADLSWQAPLQLSWTVALEAGEWVLVPAPLDSGHRGAPVVHDSFIGRQGIIVTAKGSRLRYRSVPGGAVTWERKLTFAPSWLATDARGLTVAGPGGVGRYARRDGRPIWEWAAPVAAPWLHATAGWRDPDATAPPEELSAFRLADGRLFARLGGRSLVALASANGAVLWQRLAPQSGISGRFVPNYFADEAAVVVQTSDGQRWHLDAATGRTRSKAPAATEPWPEPPLALGNGLLLFTDDEQVVAVRARTGQQERIFPLPRWASLAGLLPQLKRSGGAVIAGVGRNDVYEVMRLFRTGGRRWGEPVVVGREPVDLAAVAWDDEGWHVAVDQSFRTISPAGRVVEERELPVAATWRVEQPCPDWWLLWTEPRVSPADPPPREGRMILLPRRSKDGPGQTFTFEHFGPRGGVWPVRDGVVVVTANDVRFYRGVEQGAK